MDAAQDLDLKAIRIRTHYQAPDPERQSMNNTETLLTGGPVCPGLDLKADGPPNPAFAGNTYVSRHGLQRSITDT